MGEKMFFKLYGKKASEEAEVVLKGDKIIKVDEEWLENPKRILHKFILLKNGRMYLVTYEDFLEEGYGRIHFFALEEKPIAFDPEIIEFKEIEEV